MRIINTLEAVDTKQAKDMPPPPPPPIPHVEPQPPASKEVKAPVIKPTIKLKLGPSQPVPTSEPVKAEKKEKEKPKPMKIRKPKKVEQSAAAPTISHSAEEFDDGSNDLLEEVLAIERERDSDYNRVAGTQVAEKRKREDEESDEDEEILNLAGGDAKVDTRAEIKAPAVSTTKTPSTSQAPAQRHSEQKSKIPSEKSVTPQSSQPVVLPLNKEKKTTIPVKIKKPPLHPQPQPQPQPQPSPTLVSSSPSSSTTPINEKKCRDLIKLLLKLPQAAIFSRAVDSVLDGCPTYAHVSFSIPSIWRLITVTATMMRLRVQWT